MFDYNLLKTKTLCLQIYFLVTESSETARNAIAAIDNEEINSSTILVTCNKTLDFANKIINQLANYTKDVDNYISEINNGLKNEGKDVKIKKEHNVKKNILSLKKEQNEEFTQDEFLEIYKIDMTEDLSNSSQKQSTFKDILEKDSNTNSDVNSKDNLLESDNSDINCSPESDDTNYTLNLLEDASNSPRTLNEDDILNNIGCDTTDFESDCDTLFSGSTLVLEENLDMSRKSELNEFSISDSDKEIGEEANLNKEYDFSIKECSVVLSKCEPEMENLIKENSLDREMRQIENLINLDNLKRKHSTDYRKPSKRKKRDKVDEEDDHSADALSDSSATDCDIANILAAQYGENKQENVCNSGTTVRAAKDRCDLLNDLLDCISDATDISEDRSDEDNSGSDVDNVKDKMKTNTKKVTEEDIVENVQESATEDYISEELEKDVVDERNRKKKKWRRDKLLTEKLISGSSDDEKENNPEQRQKRKRRRKTRRKSVPDVVQLSTSSGSENSSDIDFDDIGSDNTYLSSDSTSSAVEFVKTFTKESPMKNEDQGKAGRKNIRSVQSDALLDASTKKAQREEEERLDRLEPRTQVLSQLAEGSGLVLDFDKETKESLITVDENISSRLKLHQKEGLRFMWNSCYESVEMLKESPGTGCILAHCMGLGKTFQVIALIDTLFAHSITNTKHVLIVCPLSTVLNWEDEFKICYNISKHKRKMKRYLITDGKSKDERFRIISNWYRSNGILIVGYDSFQSLLNKSVPKKIVEALLDPGPDLVVCDEGHLIKNGTRNRSKILTRIKTKRRIILTGTPMQNNLTEYFYMVDFVKPNLLGTKKEFSNRFVNPIVNGGYDDSTEADIKLMRQRSHVLHEYLKYTIQRYEITELQTYLPAKLDYVLFIQLHDLQIELYKAYLEVVGSTEHDKKNRSFFPDYMRLKDVWTHPCILRMKEQAKSQQTKRKEVDTIIVEPEIQEEMPSEWWHSKYAEDVMTNIDYGPKMNVMLEIIEHSVRLNDKVLIFGSYLAELDAIELFLNANGWRKNVSYLRMDGTVPPDIRTTFCKKFNDEKEDRIKLFLLSHQIGGLGLNLIAANRIILMDVNFNPAIDTQSIFRTYRFGQEKRCYVYRLVSMGTMEEVVYERSVTKQAVSLRVVDEHQISRHYKSNDLQKMYRFNIYTEEERPVLKLPIDEVLATILEKCKKEIFKYHEHENLLENRPEEQLNAEEQKLAWDEFRREQENAHQNQIMANNLQIQNVTLVNQGNFPSSQTVSSTNQPSTSSNPIQVQEVLTATNITAQTGNFAAIRLQQFANIANMNQQQNTVGTQNVMNTPNLVNISQQSNTIVNSPVPIFRPQAPKAKQLNFNIRQLLPNIRMPSNGKYQFINPKQHTPNTLYQVPKIRQPNITHVKQQLASAIHNTNVTNVPTQMVRTLPMSSVTNGSSRLMPLTYVNVPNKRGANAQPPSVTTEVNKTLQVTDPLATNTSDLVINVDLNRNNASVNSNKQPTVSENIINTTHSNIGWSKSPVQTQNAQEKTESNVITRLQNNNVDCIIELD